MRQVDVTRTKADVRSSFRKAADQPGKRKKKNPAPLTYRPKDEEERQGVLAAAKGMSVSEYIRQCIHDADAKPKKLKLKTPIRDEQSLARSLALLGQSRIANNLNQLAYHANTGSLLLDEETLGKIDEAYQHVCFMRKALIAALGLREAHDR
ncbi:MAG: plasmid mobilization relaxosome protein MobC [Geminicoccaceae bacterium]